MEHPILKKESSKSAKLSQSNERNGSMSRKLQLKATHANGAADMASIILFSKIRGLS
jgi:hypothetical protein